MIFFDLVSSSDDDRRTSNLVDSLEQNNELVEPKSLDSSSVELLEGSDHELYPPGDFSSSGLQAHPSVGLKRATEGGVSPLDVVKRKVLGSDDIKPYPLCYDHQTRNPAEQNMHSILECPDDFNSAEKEFDFMEPDRELAYNAEKESEGEEEGTEAEEDDIFADLTQSTRINAKAQRAEARQRERDARKKAKEDEKQAKKLARETERAERKKRQEEEQKARNQAAQLSQQARGKFSESEIGVVLHSELYDSPLGQCIRENLGDSYKVGTSTLHLPWSVRWTWRPMNLGGAAVLGEGVETHRFLAIIFNADRFLPLVIEDANGDFPALAVITESIKASVQNTVDHMVWILNGVHEEVNRRYREQYKQHRQLSPLNAVTTDDVDEAVAWLLISEGIDARCVKNNEEVAELLKDITRALAESPYKEEITPLHCVHKKKTAVVVEGLLEDELEVANNFARILQFIPGISEKKAVQIVNTYPSLKKLMHEYSSPMITEEEKELLLQDCFSKRNEAALSKKIYHYFTSEDPDEVM